MMEALPGESWLNGWFAHKNGATKMGNPYDPQTQNQTFAAWEMGWMGRFSAVTYNLPLYWDRFEWQEYKLPLAVQVIQDMEWNK